MGLEIQVIQFIDLSTALLGNSIVLSSLYMNVIEAGSPQTLYRSTFCGTI